MYEVLRVNGELVVLSKLEDIQDPIPYELYESIIRYTQHYQNTITRLEDENQHLRCEIENFCESCEQVDARQQAEQDRQEWKEENEKLNDEIQMQLDEITALKEKLDSMERYSEILAKTDLNKLIDL
jgi:predicted RNase H-like nuclease (RuvC/YqgF family)